MTILRNASLRAAPWHVFISAFLFAANLLLILPYLRTNFSDQPWNNGPIYLAIVRIFRDHPWTWNALQYCGAPLRYLYPPFLHALVIALPWVSLPRAFHAVTGCAYAAAPVCLYALAWALFRSRIAALFAGVAYSLFPSAMYLSVAWRNLAAPYGRAPWEFVTFAGYQEAAHGFAFPIALLALTAMWRGRWIIGVALAGIVFLTSWPAVVGLSFPLLGIAVARARSDGPVRSCVRVASVTGVAYGLAAFWITPDYFVSTALLNRIVLSQVPIAPAPWDRTTWMLIAAAAFAICMLAVLKAAPPIAFVLAWLAPAAAVLLAFTWAGAHVLPAPNRYMLELHAACVLAVSALLSSLRKRRNSAFAIALFVGLYSGRGFLRHPWKFFPKPQNPETGIVYQIAQWLNRNHGNSRIFASGEVEETLPLWSDTPQVGGTNQDITNFLPYAAQRYVAFSCAANAPSISPLWLQALNIRYFVVHGPRSREHYHWYSQPERWAALPVAWQSGHDDWIYDFAGSNPTDAVVVDTEALSRLPPIHAIDDPRFLSAYVPWAHGKRPARLRWTAADAAAIDVDHFGPGEAVLVKSNYAAGWRAPGAGVGPDPIGFLLIRGAPGQTHWSLRFETAWPAWLGRAVTLVTVLLLLCRVRLVWIATAAVAPAFAAFLYLMTTLPPSVEVARQAFASIQPPQIMPDAVVSEDGSPRLLPGRIGSIYGLNFGHATDTVSVWLNGIRFAPIFHRTDLIQVRVPADVPPELIVSVEVNGCRGNQYAIPIR